MCARLAFKRNPRHPPPATTALLLDSMRAKKPQWVGASGMAPPVKLLTPPHGAATAAAAAGPTTGWDDALGVSAQQLIRTEPAEVVFSGYQPGQMYFQVRMWCLQPHCLCAGSGYHLGKPVLPHLSWHSESSSICGRIVPLCIAFNGAGSCLLSA